MPSVSAVIGVALIASLAWLAPAFSESDKKPKPDVGNGRVAWFDITTTDIAKSKEFYGALFDWKFNPVKGTNLAVQIVSRRDEIGTLRVAEGKITAFNGVVYIQVDDMHAMCKKAKKLGATIPPGFPFNLPDAGGAVGLFTDPAGHPLGMYSQKALPETKSPDKG